MSEAGLLATPLHAWHKAHGGRLVDFAGWSMPTHYTSIVAEHQAVRRGVGLFDISHMGRLDFHGPDVLPWLERVTTNQVSRLVDGQIQYSLMTGESGGILDDILVGRTAHGYNVVCNASNREKVLAQLASEKPAGSGATLVDRTLGTAMIAVQGPKALSTLEPLCSMPIGSLKYYHGTAGQVAGVEAVVSRTGYTGEDGFEVIVDAGKAEHVWDALLESGRSFGIVPCGLGARDTLRFEAAMPLYGHELDETINPFEAGLGNFVKRDKTGYVGHEALERARGEVRRARVGLVLDGKRIARQGYAVRRGAEEIGLVTSGTFAPTLERSLAMALVAADAAAVGTRLEVDVRGQAEPAEVVPLPFYRRPKASG